MVELSPGTRICGHIEIVRELPASYGSSVWGRTYVGRDNDSGQSYWLTIVDGSFFANSIGLSRFMANANALTVLRHPDLVRIGLVDREEAYCVVGSEELPGAHVWADSTPAVRHNSTFDTAVAFARGLAHLHQRGITHGLFCAGNAVRRERNSLVWQFGIAALLDAKALATRCRDVDTTGVLPPELHEGVVTPATDVFLWGQTVAELLTASRGIEARERLDADFPPPGSPLLQLVRRCLSLDLRSRPRDALAVLEELERLGPDRRTGNATRPPPPPPRTATRRVPAPNFEPPSARSGSQASFELESLELATLDGQQVSSTVDRTLASPLSSESTSHLVAGATDLEGSTPLAMESATALPVLAPVVAGQGPFRMPRRAGPHGPTSFRPAFVIAAIAPLLVLGAAWPVFGLGQRLRDATDSSPPRPPADGLPAASQSDLPSEQPSERSGSTPDRGEAPVVVAKACPDHMVPASASVCIDIAEYPGRERLPAVQISHDQARERCQQRGGRLCTADEWRAACSGVENTPYPYGSQPLPDVCVTASLAGFAVDVAVAGSHDRCISSVGAFDMVGNVGEWLADGAVAGGDSTTPSADAACDAIAWPPADYRGAEVGFRCCLDRTTD